MEEPIIENSTKQKFENLREKLSLFNKTLKTQILILSLWIVALIMLIYYVIYEQSTLDLIQHSILPSKNTWIWTVAIIFIIGGIGLLFLPADPIIYEKEIFSRSIPTILEDIHQTLLSGDFALVSQKIEEQLERMQEFHIETEKEKFLEIMRKAQINKYCQEKGQMIKDLLKEEKFLEAQTEYAQFTPFLNKNYPLLTQSLVILYDELANKFLQ